MKQVFDRGEEYGRPHGNFGSGKSHFMTMLSLLVEGATPAWKKFRPLLNAHRDANAASHWPAGVRCSLTTTPACSSARLRSS